MTIFVLGPKGTYGHEAAKLLFERQPDRVNNPRIRFCPSNTEILLAVARSKEAIGVVPIENSSVGLVREVINYWMKINPSGPRLWVTEEISLPIRHCLLSHLQVKEISPCQAVYSHPQALSQCSQSLRSLKLRDQRPALSTTTAAQYIAEHGNTEAAVAIASHFAAKVYGLRVLKEDLQDFNANETYFHVVAKEPRARTKNSKTAIVFWLENKSGALHNALGAISAAGSNMTSIHSIPLGEKGEFAFYAEFQGHYQDGVTHSILTILEERRTKRLVVLGSFPAIETE